MRKRRNQFLGAPLLTALISWATAPSALADQSRMLVFDTRPAEPVEIIAYAPIYKDGRLGPWIPFGDPVEGTCAGRGFDTYEVVLATNDPCAAGCAGGSCTSRAANGAAEGGVDPFCAQTGAAGCPLDSGRFGFQATAGSFASYAVGSQAQGFTAPAYAAGQPVCEIDFTIFQSFAPGATDHAGNIVGATSYVDIVLHTGSFPASCAAAQPLFGPLVSAPGGPVSGPFGNTTAALGNLGTTTGEAIPGGYRFAYATQSPPQPLGARYRFGPIDVSTVSPPLVLPASGTYEIRFWNDAAGTIVSGNNQPALWAPKDAVIQGSTSAQVYTNDDFSPVTDDLGSQYQLATECSGTFGSTVCSDANSELGGVPFAGTIRLGVASAITNNDCANGFILVASGSTSGTTVGATSDGSASCGPATSADVWYRFEPDCSGTWTVSTSGADIVLSVHTGNCGALTQVGCASGATPSVMVAVTGGMTYRVRVATTAAGGAAFTVTSSLAAVPPPNNDCANAQAVGEGSFPFTNGCATDDGFIPTCSATSTANSDVWFLYTAGVTGDVVINTCNSTFDTVLSYHGGAGDCFAPEIACDDDFCAPGGGSQIMVSVTSGQQLLLRVSGFNGGQGSGVLSIAAAVPTVITAANPPAPGGNPYQPGLPYTDVLDTSGGAPTSALTAGIGASGTPAQGPISYAPINVTFSNPVTFGMADVSIACTRAPCPSISSVSSSGNTTTIGLSAAIPPLGCTTLTFTGGQKIQYRSRPGDPSLDGSANTGDLLAIVTGINNGMANLAGNLGRFNIDRTGGVNTQDLLREVQLLNGVNTTNVFATAGPADACPP